MEDGRRTWDRDAGEVKSGQKRGLRQGDRVGYAQLRQRQPRMRGERPSHTLQATALVKRATSAARAAERTMQSPFTFFRHRGAGDAADSC